MKYLVIQLLFVIINAYHPIAILYRGTVCGWAETTTDQPILCNGLDPRHSCPINYTQQSFQEGVAYCYKTNSTSEPQNGLIGTICGGLARNPCGGISPAVACPPGYIQDFRHVCYKNSSKIEDLSGTFCGIVNDGTGVTCDGVQLGKCPKGYVAINYDEQKWHACTKE
ncbi:unnamed protein product [Adineta steineri]|uniref:Secreted protein n=1 Tax=Adineta steineri TaxID=433720 RepID=A0A813U0Y1_9BILA|nr:unnamed protein product [Adineta steineri]